MALFQVVKESFVYTIALLLPPLAALFTLPIFTRVLSPDEYAVLTLVLTFSAVIGIVLSLQLQSAVLRFTTGLLAKDDKKSTKQFFSSTLFVTLGVMTIGVVVLEGLGPVLIRLFFSDDSLQYAPMFRYGVLSLFFTSVYALFQGLMRARRQPWLYVMASVVSLVVLLTTKFVLVVSMQTGVSGMLLGNLAGAVTGLIFAAATQHRWIVFTISWDDVQRAFSYALPLIPHAASTFVFTLSNRIILEHFVPLSSLGLFAVAASIAQVPFLLVDTFSMAYSPHFIAEAERDARALRDETFGLLRVWWVGIAGLMLGIFLLAEDVTRLLTGPAFHAAAPLVPILSLAAVGRGLYNFTSGPLFLDKTRIVPIVTVVAGIVSLGLNFLLIPFFGVTGAAWATVGAYATTFLLSHWLSKRYAAFALCLPWKGMLLVSVVCIFVGWSVLPWLTSISLFMRIATSVLITVGLCGVIFLYIERGNVFRVLQEQTTRAISFWLLKRKRIPRNAFVVIYSLKGISPHYVACLRLCGYSVGVLKPAVYLADPRSVSVDTLPDWAITMAQQNKLMILSSADIDGTWFLHDVNDRLLRDGERVLTMCYPNLQEHVKRLFAPEVSETCTTNAYKKELLFLLRKTVCLLELAQRLERRFPQQRICLFAEKKPWLFEKAARAFQEAQKNARVSLQTTISFYRGKRVWRGLLRSGGYTLSIVGLCLINGLYRKGRKRAFRVAVTLESPEKNLHVEARDPFFLAADTFVQRSDFLLLPQSSLSRPQRTLMRERNDAWAYVRYAVDMGALSILWRVVRAAWFDMCAKEAELVRAHGRFCYVLACTRAHLIQHPFRVFCTSYDISPENIIRNSFLQQRGVRTWFFDPSINYEFLYLDEGDLIRRAHNPFWQYYQYDGMVLWSEASKQYHASHTQFVKQYAVLGTLWADMICKMPSEERERVRRTYVLPHDEKKHIITAFDSSFYDGFVFDYEDGAAFIQDLLWLIEQCMDCLLIYKPKKNSVSNLREAAEFSSAMSRLKDHPRVTITAAVVRPTHLIAVSDMVISFPFTSPTYEAISARIPAIYHDPLGKFGGTALGKLPGLNTRTREDLLDTVLRYLASDGRDVFHNVLTSHAKHPYLDGHMDGKAMERLRDALRAEGV